MQSRLKKAGNNIILAKRLAKAPSFRDALQMDSPDGRSADGSSDAADNQAPVVSDPVELDRVTLRLDGFEMYAFLTSLIAGFSFSCLDGLETWAKTSTSPKFVSELLMVVFSLSLMISIFSGLYATVVFALCSLYSKTALAEGKDQRMRDFLRETATFRTRGFRSFIICMCAAAALPLPSS